jgi:hypothetical protein
MTDYREREHTALDQLLDTLEGKQNFCIIEERKANILFAAIANLDHREFAPYVEDVTIEITWNGHDHTDEVIVGREGFFDAYQDLLKSRDSYLREDYQIAFGRLLGYSEESIQEFIKSDVAQTCECSKCGGKLAPPKRNLLHVEPYTTADEDGKFFQTMTLDSEPYGRLYEVDEDAVFGNDALQPWSRPV